MGRSRTPGAGRADHPSTWTAMTSGGWTPLSIAAATLAGLLMGAALVAATLAAGRSGSDPTPVVTTRPADAPVRIATFDFAESELLGELFAQALEDAGVEVERVPALGSREVVAPALHQGVVDLVPEYLAAALDFETLGAGVPFTEAEAARRLAEELSDDGVTVLPHAPAVNRDAVAMHEARASELGIESVADLAEHDDELDFVGPPECQERPVCLPRLEEDYDIEFRAFTGVPPGLAVALALAAGEADVGLMFSTDSLVADHDLVLLEDRRGRPEHVVPLVRDQILRRHGAAITATLARVTSALTTEELMSMNHRASHGETIAAVVDDWLGDLR